MDDGLVRLLLSMFAQQLSIDPESNRVIVGCRHNGPFRAGFRLVDFCRHEGLFG